MTKPELDNLIKGLGDKDPLMFYVSIFSSCMWSIAINIFNIYIVINTFNKFNTEPVSSIIIMLIVILINLIYGSILFSTYDIFIRCNNDNSRSIILTSITTYYTLFTIIVFSYISCLNKET